MPTICLQIPHFGMKKELSLDEQRTQFINHFTEVWKLKEQCRAIGLSSLHSKNDVRTVWFNQMMNLINQYYFGMLAPNLMMRIGPAFSDGVLKSYFPDQDEIPLIENMGFLLDPNYLKTWREIQPLHLISGCWIVFEDSIDLLYAELSNEEDQANFKDGIFNKIKKHLSAVSESDLNEIKLKLKSEYIGVSNKYNFIFNSLGNAISKRKLKELRQFLFFFNTLRNSLHLNSRPQKDYTFNLPIGTLELKKNVHADVFTLEVLLYSLKTFVEIFSLLSTHLTTKKEIVNPSTQLDSWKDHG